MSDRRKRGDDLTGRRQGYAALKKELHHFFRRIWIITILIGASSTLALVAYGFVLAEIQNQRFEVCENQNERHENTVATLRFEAGEDIKNAPTKAIEIDIVRRRDVALALIRTLAPKRNCHKVVETGFEAYAPW